MNTYRYSEAQRRAWVQAKQNKTKKVAQILAEAGISRATLYHWVAEFDAQEKSADARPGSLPKKSRTSAGATDEQEKYEMLKAALTYTDTDGSAARKIIQALVRRYTITVEQACIIAGADPAQHQYKVRKPEVDDALVHAELARLLTEEPARSFEDCYSMIRSSHPSWSRKQLRRIYRDERLYLQRRRKRGGKMAAENTSAVVSLQRPGATWHIGVNIRQQHWQLFIIDVGDNAVLSTLHGTGLPNEDDIRALLDKGMVQNGKPMKLRVPGVPPFNQRPVIGWAWEQKVALHTLSMGKEENVALQGHLEDMVRNAEKTATAP